jgi:hypothetical protein
MHVRKKETPHQMTISATPINWKESPTKIRSQIVVDKLRSLSRKK